jgi:hypothetical protein
MNNYALHFDRITVPILASREESELPSVEILATRVVSEFFVAPIYGGYFRVDAEAQRRGDAGRTK